MLGTVPNNSELHTPNCSPLSENPLMYVHSETVDTAVPTEKLSPESPRPGFECSSATISWAALGHCMT